MRDQGRVENVWPGGKHYQLSFLPVSILFKILCQLLAHYSLGTETPQGGKHFLGDISMQGNTYGPVAFLLFFMTLLQSVTLRLCALLALTPNSLNVACCQVSKQHSLKAWTSFTHLGSVQLLGRTALKNIVFKETCTLMMLPSNPDYNVQIRIQRCKKKCAHTVLFNITL